VPDALIILAKAPAAGRVKTRLAAAIGADAALAVYRALLAITARTAQAWPGPVVLSASGDDFTGTGLERLPRIAQVDGGLGARVAQALTHGLALAPRAIAIGTDCPALTPAALAALPPAEIALGPTPDGGYWAVAVTSARAIAVVGDEALPWSTPRLRAATRAAAAAAGIAVALGPILADVDDRDDLHAACADGHLAPQLASGAPP
jgi:hypothetical protein